MARSLQSLWKRVRSVGGQIYRGKYVERMRFTLHGRKISDEIEGNALIARALESGKPFATGKIGDVEMEALRKRYYIPGGDGDDARWKGRQERLHVSAGVYPPTPDVFRRFCPEFIAGLREVSILGVWFNRGEERITREHCPEAKLIPIRSLAPYVFDDPWSSRLEGKRVLIATPFPKSIARQLERREQIWTDARRVLPAFASASFITVPPHSFLLEKPVYPDWFAGLESLKREVSRHEFDVFLVGAGAWSIPLAAYATSLGKVGIHLGGDLQMLFGVKGRRWVGTPAAVYFNDAWINPLPEETPEPAKKLERGDYW